MNNSYQDQRKRVFAILEAATPGDIPSRIVDLGLMILIGANVIAVIMESVTSIRMTYHNLFIGFEVFSVWVFTVEYTLRLWTCVEREDKSTRGNTWQSRLRYAVSPIALCDLLAILPSYIWFFVGMDLRFLRILRLLRVFKLTRYSPALNLLFKAIRDEADSLGVILFILLILLILASSGIYLVEREAQPQAFGSIPAAMWWAVATLTTVGYGDVTPITPTGKVFGALITIIGIGMVALPSGLLASGFTEQLRLRRKKYEQEVDKALEAGPITQDRQQMLDKKRIELGFSEEEAAAILELEAQRQLGEHHSHCPHCGKPI